MPHESGLLDIFQPFWKVMSTSNSTGMFIMALFIFTKTCNNQNVLQGHQDVQDTCNRGSSIDLWYIHTLRFYLAIKLKRYQAMQRPGWIINACFQIKESSLKNLHTTYLHIYAFWNSQNYRSCKHLSDSQGCWAGVGVKEFNRFSICVF